MFSHGVNDSNSLAGDVVDNTLKTLEVGLVKSTSDATRGHALHTETNTEGVHAGTGKSLTKSV